MRKAAGITLILIGLLLYVIVFSVALHYGLFLAMVMSLPAFYIVLFGCSLILGGGFKRAILWWLMFTALNILPWIAVLSITSQLVSYALLATIFVSVIVWYHRKLMLQKGK